MLFRSPKKVLDRAHEVLFNLEQSEFDEMGVPKISHSENHENQLSSSQLGLFPDSENPLTQKIRQVDPNELSPREALEVLFELTKLLKKDSP